MNALGPKIIVGLYLRGKDLDPELITRSTGVQPSKSQRRGDKSFTSTGHEVVKKIGVWAIVIELESHSLEEHLSQLADSLPSGGRYSGIAGVEEAYIDIFVALASSPRGEASCDFEIGPSSIEMLSQLGLPVRLSLTAGPE